MRWTPGSTATMTASFQKATGEPVDPSGVMAAVRDANGTVLASGTPTKVVVGDYAFTFNIPVDAVLGLWRIEWSGNVGGLLVLGDEEFDVVAQEGEVVVVPGDLSDRLRGRLGEVSKLPPEENGSDTMFTNTEIRDFLVSVGNDLDLASVEGWLHKAARYAVLVDINENGSDRNLSQKFRNSQKMADFWSKRVAEAHKSRSGAVAGRVVGRVVSLRQEACDKQYPFSESSDNIREYPTHRLIIPAVLA